MTAPQESLRYFYTDPLAAAWMAKHFGMMFDSSPTNFLFAPDGAPVSFHPSRYFVHPDSLPLLEPRVGDLVTCIGVSGWRIERIEGRNFFTHDGHGQQYHGKLDEARIILRDGKPFHSPEQEAV